MAAAKGLHRVQGGRSADGGGDDPGGGEDQCGYDDGDGDVAVFGELFFDVEFRGDPVERLVAEDHQGDADQAEGDGPEEGVGEGVFGDEGHGILSVRVDF